MREEELQWQEVRVNGRSAEGSKGTALRSILEIVSPTDAILVEEIKDRAGDGSVAAGGRKGVAGSQMPEGRGSQEIGAVRKSRTEKPGEVAVIYAEVLGEVVVVWSSVADSMPLSFCSVASLTRTKPSLTESRRVLLG